MSPTIHIVRHAEATHNVSFDLVREDPPLTERGHHQCAKLASEFAQFGDKIVCVLASPMRRTIETALATFGPYTKSRKLVLLPDLQEYGVMPSDMGVPREVLESAFGTDRIDFSLLQPGWHHKNPDSQYQPHRAIARAQSVRLFVRAIAQSWKDSDAHIVLVSHGRFIEYLVKSGRRLFSNAEWRSYRFEHLVGRDMDADFVEADGIGEIPLGPIPLKPAILPCDRISTGLLARPVATGCTGAREKGDQRPVMGCLGTGHGDNKFTAPSTMPELAPLGFAARASTEFRPLCCCGGLGSNCIRKGQDGN